VLSRPLASTPHYIARWNGSAFEHLGSGVNGPVYEVEIDSDGAVLAVGEFTQAGGLALNDRLARWNGTQWHNIWLDLPGTPIVYDIALGHDGPLNDRGKPRTGRIAVGFQTSGTATASNVSDTTVTTDGTAPASPMLQITGPATIDAIINMTTGRELFFDLYIMPGEIATLDLRAGRPSFSSTYRKNLLPYILSSHPSRFKLEPGDNTILVKLSSSSGATAFNLQWIDEFISVDS
jgi:hypothetical protein